MARRPADQLARLPRRLALLVQPDLQERQEGLARRAPRGCRARQGLRGHLGPMARKGRKEPLGYKVLPVQRVSPDRKVRPEGKVRKEYPAFALDAADRRHLLPRRRHLRPQSGACALQRRPACPRWPERRA